MSRRGGKPTNAKGMCRICHHRADKHYPTPPEKQKLESWQEPSRVEWCHEVIGGSFCGCVGHRAGADGDRKRARR